MGRNKFSESEIKEIARLLDLKNTANRLRQKQIRHTLRVKYEFNIADFNQPGQAFGSRDLHEAIRRHAIFVLDDATIADMKAKRQRDRQNDEALRQADVAANADTTDWHQALEEWERQNNPQA